MKTAKAPTQVRATKHTAPARKVVRPVTQKPAPNEVAANPAPDHELPAAVAPTTQELVHTAT